MKKLKKILCGLLAVAMVCQSASFTTQASDTKLSKDNITKISAKSAQDHGAELAIDGNTSTYWQSIPAAGDGDVTAYTSMYAHNHYIDITLDGTYQLSQLKIFNNTGSYNNYYIYASVDGENYDKIVSKTSNEVATAAGDSFTVDVEASYLRLNMAYNSDAYVGNLAELEIYGTKKNDTVQTPAAIEVEDWEGSSWQIEWDKFESDTEYAEAKVLAEMSNLVGRVLGDEWKDSFVFKMRGDLNEGTDIFEVKNGTDGKIVIRGNSGVAMASGFNYYIKYYLNLDYNPLFGSNVSMDGKTIVPVEEKIVKEAQYDLRYALNFCTYSYTMAFWNWDEYEEFIDWAAMNGLNLILDIVGQEEVLRQTLLEYGYTDEEIKDYICGPAYFAWFYMQNLYSVGGPLPNSWFEQRTELGRQMHDRMQTYGIDPVIQGFSGQVPETFPSKNEGAELTPIDSWPGHTRPALLKPYDSEVDYFSKVAETFYEKQKNVFGDVSNYYATDPFHEGGNTGGLDIATIFQRVQEEMLESDENAMWVMQQWQGNLNANKMSKLDTSHCIALDLQADMNPQHGLFENNGTPWIYCMLHNFGGRMGLDGELPVISSDPIETANSTKYMTGIGITPEALENSPVAYELFLEMTWSSDPIDYNEWADKYAERRAGGTSESLQEAWDILVDTAYADKGIYYQGAAETVINARPGTSFGSASTWGHSNILYDKSELDEALRLLTENYEAFQESEAFKYDLADVAEQVLCNAAVEYHTLMVAAFNQGNVDEFKALSNKFLEIIDLSDKVLSTTDEFMLGTWIEAARSMITDADDWTKDLFEFNARILVTTWGGQKPASNGGLKDYSNRKWSGLTSSFYKERWAIWIRNRTAELEGTTKDAADAKAENNWFLWEFQWVNRKSDDDNGAYAFATTPSNEDLGALATEVYETYSYTALKTTGGVSEEKVNVVSGKVPTLTTGTTNSGKLANITDGDTGSEWVGTGTANHVLVFDLEGTYQLDEIVLSVPQLANKYPYTYKIEGLNPETNEWVTLATYSDSEGLDSNTTIDVGGVASQLRLTAATTDATDDPLTIAELVVYGTAVEATETETWENLALGVTPTTNKTNTNSSNPLTNITDGDTTNLWKTTDWGANAYPADVTVTLEDSAYVEYLEIYFEKAGLPFKFYVTVTDKDGNETIVYDEYREYGDSTDAVTDVLPTNYFSIPVGKEIVSATVYYLGITGEGTASVAGPAMSELMLMQAQMVVEDEEATTEPVDFLADKLSGVTVSGGNASANVIDGSKTTYNKVTTNTEITFDLGKEYYLKNVDLTFEKGELGLKYMVYTEDANGNRTTVCDKSSTTELLGEATITVPVNGIAQKVIFVHMGNNGQGPAYAAESRLYEFEAYGISVDTTLSAIKTTEGTSVVAELATAGDVQLVAVENKSTDALSYTVEYWDGTAEDWKTFAVIKNDTATKSYAVIEEAVYTTKLRFTFDEGASYGDITIYKADKTQGLTNRILEIEVAVAALTYDGSNGSYDAADRATLEAVLADAKAFVKNAATTNVTSAEVSAWLAKVEKAVDTFYRNGVVYINRTGLLTAISDAKELLEKLETLGYTDEKASLQEVYNTVYATYKTYNTTQTVVDSAKAALVTEMAKYEDLSCTHPETECVGAKAATCTEAGYTGDTVCTLCDEVITAGQSIAAAGHAYTTTTTKATTKTDATKVKTCANCGDKKTEITARQIKSVTLSQTSYTYNGKAKKPTVKVKDVAGNTISSKYYTVSYAKGRKSVGEYKVKVTFKGDYSGTVTKAFVIKPKATSWSSYKGAKKAISLKWKKQAKEVTGYQIQYCTTKNFKSGVKNVWVKSAKTTSKTVKSLKAKKTYYVRIRTYKTVNKTKIYSSWSAVKKVKTK